MTAELMTVYQQEMLAWTSYGYANLDGKTFAPVEASCGCP